MNAMIVAAGLGTRLRPYTNDRPKALVAVDGKPMLYHQMEKLKAAGCEQVVVNVHHFGQQIIDAVREQASWGMDVHISDERALLLDTGGGVRQATTLFTKEAPVLIHNVDVFSTIDLKSFYEHHQHSGADVSLLVSKRPTSRYLYFDEDSRLVGWKNLKTGEVRTPIAAYRTVLEEMTDVPAFGLVPLAFAGIHVISPSVFPLLQSYGEVFSIIDFYLSVSSRLDVRGVKAPEDFRWVDAGKPEALPLAAEIVRQC